ncbi:cytochrome c oxidase subunit II [Salinibacterium sp. dk2585]|uniref:aa3-type cytochrome oxidase subunit II n=1 Tax=unclassified Salinibacterium TaxID=2632331 RepID=UPI0011C24AA8|nr:MULTISPECIES: cytochrome c oxidase subunit II [unclassified Salinibacterium]QEE61133.1 cytochrome c oxidase subunit II [Salinibacterium sp. dk2585]TXK53076.1 cytochrome c oxidase subunit II [Salinibacterium sp. dk5596]
MSSERSQVRSNRRLRWAAVPLAASLVVVLAGCTQAQLRGYLPGEPGITNHTDRIAGLWTTSWMVLLVVGIVTWGLVLWVATVYRRRKGQTGLPVQLRYNMPIEILYTVVPLILVMGFFAFTARDQAAIEEPIEDPDVQIEVYAKRWAWDFNYLNEGPGGEGVHYQGIQAQETEKSPYIDYDLLPVLYLPVDKTVEIALESRDVIHSFWVVDFLYKKDTVPGKSNYMYFTPQEEGEYIGKCAELCGEYHALMLFKVKVVSEAEYDAYIQSLVDAGNTGIRGAEYNTNSNLPGTEPVRSK